MQPPSTSGEQGLHYNAERLWYDDAVTRPTSWTLRTREPLRDTAHIAPLGKLQAAATPPPVWQTVQIARVTRREDRRNWCWAAVAENVHRWRAHVPAMSQCQIAGAALQPQRDCCAAGSACDLQWHLDSALRVTKSLADGPLVGAVPAETLYQELGAGRPVAIRVEASGTGHFLLVHAFLGGEHPLLTLFDPEPGRGSTTIGYAELKTVGYAATRSKWTHTYLVR